MSLVQVAWAVLGLIVVVGAMLAHRSRTAHRVALWALALLYLPAGAAVHAWYLATDVSYSGFTDLSWSSFVTETWESLVVPHDWVFIGLLIAFEATAGVLVLLGGRARDIALWALVAFFVAVVSFSPWYLLWSVPMSLALVRLWEVGRRRAPSYSGRHVREVAETRA